MKKLFLVATLSCAVGVIATVVILKYQFERTVSFLFVMEQEGDVSMMASFLRLADKGDQKALKSAMTSYLGCLFNQHDRRVLKSGIEASSIVESFKAKYPEAADDPLCGDLPI